MQCGFAFLEAGAVRSKNCTNILIKNVLDSLLGILGYWAIGWALAYGPNSNNFLDHFFGFSQFFVIGLQNYAKFFFQFVFAATAATIISGAVAERAEFACFLTYSLLITSFCYPILTHWGWTPNGWMARGFDPSLGLEQHLFENNTLNNNSSETNITTITNTTTTFRTTYVDFAGSGMVHLCGGTISLIAALLIGPRIGRFPEKEARQKNKVKKGKQQRITPLRNVGTEGKLPKIAEIKGHSVPFASLGGFILMFGFLAFNGGSTGEISTKGVGQIVAKVMVNTILCGAFAALSYLFVHFIRKGKWTILLTINACLTGMVSACAGCDKMPVWTSAITGSIAGMAYLAFSELCLIMRIDDPLDAFAVHFGGGLWGLISACLVTEKGLLFSLIDSEKVKFDEALWQLCWQSVCAVAIIVWSALVLTPAFLILKAFGKMRVPREVEIRGLDIFKHGEAAYPLTAYGHGWGDGTEFVITPLQDVGGDAVNVTTMMRPTREGGGIQQYPHQQFEHPEHFVHRRQKQTSATP